MMSDYKDTKDSGEETAAQEKTRTEISERGKSAIQGDLNWTKEDGSQLHYYYENAVQESIEDTDQGIHVYNEDPIITQDGEKIFGKGKIDTRIDQEVDGRMKTTLIDYKTNDMSQWSHADARRHANEHASQMRDYMDSPNTPDDAKGFLIQVGKKPDDPSILETYSNTAKEYDVTVKFPDGGTSKEVTQSVREAMDETRSA